MNRREILKAKEREKREMRDKLLLDRNLKGIDLEKEGKIDESIKLYEANIADNSEGNHPYDRLSIIYRKRNQIDDEIRVLEKGIWVFKNIVHEGRQDRLPKLRKFEVRLNKAMELKQKRE